MACKAKDVYYLVLYRKTLPTPGTVPNTWLVLNMCWILQYQCYYLYLYWYSLGSVISTCDPIFSPHDTECWELLLPHFRDEDQGQRSSHARLTLSHPPLHGFPSRTPLPLINVTVNSPRISGWKPWCHFFTPFPPTNPWSHPYLSFHSHCSLHFLSLHPKVGSQDTGSPETHNSLVS